MGCRRRRAEEGQLGRNRVAVHPARLGHRRVARKAHGVCLFALLFCVACTPGPQNPPASPSRALTVGFPEGDLVGDLGPSQFANMLTLEGLTWGNVDGRSISRLAESWRWEDDGRRLRVRLARGVTFHDGTPLTAQTVADILMQAIARSDRRALYSSLSDITALLPEGPELVFVLSRRSAFLPDDLNMPLSLGSNVGTGAFRFVTADREKGEWRFERFEQYYQGLPAIFDALRTAWSSMLRGDVDMVTDVPAEAIEFIRSNDVDVIGYKRWYQFIVAFNSRHPSFKLPQVRRALNMAIDRDALITRALRGYASPATGPLWPKHWAYDATITPFGTDRQSAMQLLDDAGMVAGAVPQGEGIPGARLRFTCLMPADFSIHERIGLELQKQLYDIGVDMQFEIVPLLEYDTRIREGRFEAVMLDSISGPSFGKAYIFWASQRALKGLNFFGYDNPEVDRLFGLLRDSSMNEAATRSATNRLQRLFLEDPPALFLAWNERSRVIGPRFQPVYETDRDPVLTLWRWTPGDIRMASAQ
jgi:peptide/nickel transport system substrate-binding protein